MAGQKTAFCKQFVVPFFEFKWFDMVGLAQLASGHTARLELASNGVHLNYPGLQLSIIDKTNGSIDKKYFLFNDYLDITSNRKDDRGPGKKNEYVKDFHVWHNQGCIDWYIAEPKDLLPLTSAISSYISFFK